ncbi:MAG: DNA/RNA helicase domain-containing protein, partial [Streptosporangiaceae bacterium]
GRAGRLCLPPPRRAAHQNTPARIHNSHYRGLYGSRGLTDELLAAAGVPVFLLDEHQVVRPGEMDTVDDIEAHAKHANLSVVKVALDAQFRCGGSEEYLRWVLRLLGLAPGGPIGWAGDPAFSVQLA